MTLTRLHISTFLALAAAAWFGVLLLQGTVVSWEHLRPFGTVVTVLVLAAAALEHVLWRQPWLHGWFVRRPDLRGTWLVSLESDWVDPETREAQAPISCFLGVEQTLSSLQMHLMTEESESWFIADKVRPSDNETGYQIIGVYSNQPELPLRGRRSEIHRGAVSLETHGSPSRPETLTGEYWTDRGTKGTITARRFEKKVFTRFEDARSATASETI